MDRGRLPPLNALHVFEAAARLLSFTRAAAELNVTQSAVSHQIRALEARMGIALFRRAKPGQGLLLTDAARALLPVVQDSFARLADGLDRVIERDASVGGVLTVSVSPSFATKWLARRLGRFRERHPEIELRVSVSQRHVDFAREPDIDLAVRHGVGGWPELRADRFLDDEVFPVCSPALLDGPHPLRAPADLRRHALLEDVRHRYWEEWLAAAGVPDLRSERGRLAFDDIGVALEAAASGQGVAMGRATLVEDDLESGRLARPFELGVPVSYGYYVVCPEATARRPRIEAFRAWLLEEAWRPGRG